MHNKYQMNFHKQNNHKRYEKYIKFSKTTTNKKLKCFKTNKTVDHCYWVSIYYFHACFCLDSSSTVHYIQWQCNTKPSNTNIAANPKPKLKTKVKIKQKTENKKKITRNFSSILQWPVIQSCKTQTSFPKNKTIFFSQSRKNKKQKQKTPTLILLTST